MKLDENLDIYEFYDYNIEQQASIVADYWAVSVKRRAYFCTNPKVPEASDYYDLISQVQNPSGPTKKANPFRQ